MVFENKKYLKIIISVIFVALLIGISRSQKTFLGTSLNPAVKVAQKTIDYINSNILKGQTAILESVRPVSGVYEFKLKIDNQEYTSYVTRDGKILFISGIEITPSTKEISTSNNTKVKQTCETLTKADTPLLEAFVVAKCPFGLQMERILSEIVKNIPEAAQYIKVEYMGSIVNGKAQSMHDSAPGGEEAMENMRQVCLREEQPNTFWNYVNCHIQKGEVNSCLTQAKVDVNKLNSCLTDPNKGLAYIKKDFENQDKYGVTGSPTLILNSKTVSEFDFGGRTAEAVKTVLCCGFKNQPSFCSQKLTTDQAATGFSTSYKSGSSSSGSCN
jgi:predicted aspartyl protease